MSASAPISLSKIPDVWIVKRSGFMGDLNACKGVAYHLTPTPKVIDIEIIDKQGGPEGYMKSFGNDFPDFILSSSIGATPHVLDFKRLSGGKTFLVQLNDPQQRHHEFDLIANPSHAMKLHGSNVMQTLGIAHDVTHESIRNGQMLWKDELSGYDHPPRMAVILGGDVPPLPHLKGGGPWKPQEAARLGKQIGALTAAKDALLFLINSPRTTPASWEAFMNEIGGGSVAFAHDYRLPGARGNPYHALLGFADILIPTADSMSMCSECCFTGKPVYIAGLDHSNVRSDHRALAEQLFASGHARSLEQLDEPWPSRPEPLDAASDIAKEALRRWQNKNRSTSIAYR